jgi:hypothetical protein
MQKCQEFCTSSFPLSWRYRIQRQKAVTRFDACNIVLLDKLTDDVCKEMQFITRGEVFSKKDLIGSGNQRVFLIMTDSTQRTTFSQDKMTDVAIHITYLMVRNNEPSSSNDEK